MTFADLFHWFLVLPDASFSMRIVGAVVLFVAIMFVIWVFRTYILRRLERLAERTGTRLPLIVMQFVERVPLLAWAVLAAAVPLQLFSLPPTVDRILVAVILIVGLVLGTRLAQQVLEYVLSRYAPGLRRSGKEGSLPAALHILLAIAIWVLGALLVLSNLGINVVSLLTGLGIGGIAIALAVQNILGDMFSAFTLYFDRPFKEGDFIIVGQHMGIVKQIGLKSTRIQALQGEEIVISNQELTSTRVQNFKQMHERRVILRFGVTYDTTPAQLKGVQAGVRAVIEEAKNVRFDRAHFYSFGDSSLDFEAVYFVLSGEYNVFMDIQQDINLRLMEKLSAEGIQFAFPTRTVHIASDADSAKSR